MSANSTIKSALILKLTKPLQTPSKSPQISFFQCDHCPKICKRKELLTHHLKVHFGRREFKCEQCGRGFNRPHILDRHKKSHLEAIKCKVCERAIKPNSLQQHMKIHSESPRKNLECSICARKFAKNYLLAEHLMLHSSPDAFRCGDCGKTFKSSDSLKRHKREIHENCERNYKCSRCDYKTNDKRNLTKHESKHDRDLVKLNYFSCKKCSALLKSSGSLWKHMKQVHSKVHVICEICGSNFKTQQYLSKHIETFH